MIKYLMVTMISAAALMGLLIYDHNANTAKAAPTTTTTVAPTTTSTTIDLSFLNTTTTTTQPKPPQTTNVDEFFECVRWRESRGDYTAVNPTGTFMGAYQIYQGGWDAYAARIDRHDLIGTQPHTATPADQDAVALAMYNDLGAKPWGGACQ